MTNEEPAEKTAGDAEHPQVAAEDVESYQAPATMKVGDLTLVATNEENVLMDPQTGELYTSAGQRLGRMRKLS